MSILPQKNSKRILAVLPFVLLVFFASLPAPVLAQDEPPPLQHNVQPGDTWTALAFRYGLSPTVLRFANPHPNRQWQPVIGSTIIIPSPSVQDYGSMLRSSDGGLLGTSLTHNVNPWHLALANEFPSPYRPLLYRPIFIAGGESPPQELPIGFQTLELSPVPASPGQALAFRAIANTTDPHSVTIGGRPFNTFANGIRLVGLTGTDASFSTGDHEFTIELQGEPLWSQPWRLVRREWIYQQLTLTGDAAAIDQGMILQERERLFAIWNQATEEPMWTAAFQFPIEQYLEQTAPYGAWRSYNGGPYRSFHEGLDFSAYKGSPVLAPAAGTIVLAEFLQVRGGAVIIDHGLGVYSGVYHLSEILSEPGQTVTPGELIGKVGTTGLSTGNHLHWDLLVNGAWVDAALWLEQNLACWISEGFGKPCLTPAPSNGADVINSAEG